LNLSTESTQLLVLIFGNKPRKGFILNKKLYVGSLSYTTTENSLETLFSQAGQVDSVRIITDRETGRAKGFGFVQMSSEAQAEEAIRSFNGTELDGRTIVVNEANPQRSPNNNGYGTNRRNNNSERQGGYR
jgi:cold-inducible RNA-binding protein